MTKKKRGPNDSFPQLTLLKGGHSTYPNEPSAGILEIFPNPSPGRDYTVRFDCLEFTSVCPVTGQPDFGKIEIRYSPAEVCVESKSLKLYLGSYRNQGSFAEAIVNQILDDLVSVLAPEYVRVKGSFSPRGGIGIDVVAEYPDMPDIVGMGSDIGDLFLDDEDPDDDEDDDLK